MPGQARHDGSQVGGNQRCDASKVISTRLLCAANSQPKQQDAFYKDSPDSREQAQNVPPDCKAVSATAFDLWEARRFIIAERVVDGADTPLGHRYSNMVELIENYRAAGSAFQVSHIKAALVRTVAEIAEIKGRRALPAPSKMLESA